MKLNYLLSSAFLLGIAKLAQCYSGDLTYYGASGNGPSSSRLPACGRDSHYNTEFYVAINHYDFDETKTGDSSSSATMCDQCVKITRNGKYAIGRIVDRCHDCARGNIDVSLPMFEKLALKKEGRVDASWELLSSCSELGSYGSGSGSSSSNKTTKKTTKKSTTTKKRTTTTTTTTTRKTTTTTTTTTIKTVPVVPQTTVGNTIINTTVPSSIPTSINIPNNGLPSSNITVSTNNINNNTVVQPNQPNQPNKVNTTPIKQKEDTEQKEDASAEEESKGNSAPYIVSGALAVTGAAAIGLLYAKRNSNNYQNIKNKFPEAFSNLKRSITRGSSNIRRGLTRSKTALRSTVAGRRAANHRTSLMENYPPVNTEPQPTIKIYDN